MWTGNRTKTGGPGSFNDGSRLVPAFLYAWSLAGNPAVHPRALRRTCAKPLCVNPSHREVLTTEARFWHLVKKTENCWVWDGEAITGGYGRFSLDGRRCLAHRYSWELANGPIPQGLDVLHRCDNPPCVNPAHLFLGLDADNAADMVSKGRSLRGERAPRAKLTSMDVVAIRQSTLDARLLAQHYGVTRATIYLIRRRGSWRHI